MKVQFWVIVLASGSPASYSYNSKGEAERALRQRLENPLGPPEAWYGARILPAYVEVGDLDDAVKVKTKPVGLFTNQVIVPKPYHLTDWQIEDVKAMMKKYTKENEVNYE